MELLKRRNRQGISDDKSKRRESKDGSWGFVLWGLKMRVFTVEKKYNNSLDGLL